MGGVLAGLDSSPHVEQRHCRGQTSQELDSVSDDECLREIAGERTQVTKKFCKNRARGKIGTTKSDMMGIR